MDTIGLFPLYAMGIALFMIALTFLVKFTRGLIILVLGISVAYYYGIASPHSKRSMDHYMKRVVKSIGSSSLVKDIEKDTVHRVKNGTKSFGGYSKSLGKSAKLVGQGMQNF